MAEGGEPFENIDIPLDILNEPEYEYDEDLREVDPFNRGSMPQVDRLTQQRTELTSQRVDRYIKK